MGRPCKIARHNVDRDAGQHHKNNGQKTPISMRSPPIGGAHIADFLFQTMSSFMSMMMFRQVLTSSFGLTLQRNIDPRFGRARFKETCRRVRRTQRQTALLRPNPQLKTPLKAMSSFRAKSRNLLSTSRHASCSQKQIPRRPLGSVGMTDFSSQQANHNQYHSPLNSRRAKTSPLPVSDHKSVTMLGSCKFQGNVSKGENISQVQSIAASLDLSFNE